MSLEHKRVSRHGDEFVCTVCGKSWDAADRDPPECVEVSVTGRHINRTSMALAAMAAASPMTMAQARKMQDDFRKEHPGIADQWATPPAVFDQVQSKGALTSADFSQLEQRCVAAAVEGSGMEAFFCAPWPSPLAPTVQAFLAYDVEDEQTCMLIYGDSQHQAHQYAIAVTRKPATIAVRRLQGMDRFGIGHTPYVDANPRNLQSAAKMGRVTVLNLLQWRRA